MRTDSPTEYDDTGESDKDLSPDFVRVSKITTGNMATFADMKAYLERERPQALPKSPIGQAIAYTLSNWDVLVRYCQDGDLEVDNNGANGASLHLPSYAGVRDVSVVGAVHRHALRRIQSR